MHFREHPPVSILLLRVVRELVELRATLYSAFGKKPVHAADLDPAILTARERKLWEKQKQGTNLMGQGLAQAFQGFDARNYKPEVSE